MIVPVTLRTNLLDLVEQYPELKGIFDRHGIPWLDITCLDKTDNLIEDAAAICGIIPDELLDELNRALEELQEGEAHASRKEIDGRADTAALG